MILHGILDQGKGESIAVYNIIDPTDKIWAWTMN